MNSQNRLSFLLEKLRHQDCSAEELEELKKLMTEKGGQNFDQYLDEDLEKQSNLISKEKSEAFWQAISKEMEGYAPIQIQRKPILRKLVFRWAAAAAVIGLLFFADYQFFSMDEKPAAEMVIANHLQADEAKLVVLPDGSKVLLNQNSELTYPANFFQ